MTEKNDAPAPDAESDGEALTLEPDPLQEIYAQEKQLAEQVAEHFGLETREFRQQYELVVKKAFIIDVLRQLKTDERWQLNRLMDITAVDHLKLDGAPERFAVIYCLYSTTRNARLRLRVWVDEEDPTMPTASRVHAAANWGERECYDMFGIEFIGHPNLERILMPLDFGSFPLRKDYPLRGRGERDDFPRLRRDSKDV